MRKTFSFKTLIFYYAISKRQNIQKWKFFGSAKNFWFQFLRIWLHLLKKSLMENFIFCAVLREGKT